MKAGAATPILGASPSQAVTAPLQTSLTPQVTVVDPPRPVAQPTRQLLVIRGSGFTTQSRAVLRIGSSQFDIPADRTQVKDSTTRSALASPMPAGGAHKL